MFKNATPVTVVLKAKSTFATRDITLDKEYQGTYIEPYGFYSFRGVSRQNDGYAGVKLIDDIGDEIILCTETNRGNLIISPVTKVKATENNIVNTNSKQQALKELEELKARAAALEKILSEPDGPKVFQGVLLEQRQDLRQYYITTTGIVDTSRTISDTDARLGLAYVDEATANKALRHLELVQMYRKAAAKAWGGVKPKWTSGAGTKYVLQAYGDRPSIDSFVQTYSPYHFRTQSAAEDFKNSLSTQDFILLVKGLDA